MPFLGASIVAQQIGLLPEMLASRVHASSSPRHSIPYPSSGNAPGKAVGPCHHVGGTWMEF